MRKSGQQKAKEVLGYLDQQHPSCGNCRFCNDKMFCIKIAHSNEWDDLSVSFEAKNIRPDRMKSFKVKYTSWCPHHDLKYHLP